METIQLNNISDIEKAAGKILQQTKGKKILAFFGELGSGKTTIIKAICQLLNAENSVTSPTFSLVNEYLLPNRNKIFHIDFYRINDIEEIYDFGYEEYLYSPHICLIEWPEKIESLLPENTAKIYIQVVSKNERIIKIK